MRLPGDLKDQERSEVVQPQDIEDSGRCLSRGKAGVQLAAGRATAMIVVASQLQA